MIENPSQTVKEISDNKEINNTIVDENISETPKEEEAPATEEAPTPTPPMKRKNEKTYGSVAKLEPKAEVKYNTPIQNKVFLRPNLSHGTPPDKAPKTVPHRAMDIIKIPWNQSPVFQSFWIDWSAPEITMVSKPNKNPANATVITEYLIPCLFERYINK